MVSRRVQTTCALARPKRSGVQRHHRGQSRVDGLRTPRRVVLLSLVRYTKACRNDSGGLKRRSERVTWRNQVPVRWRGARAGLS